MAIAALKEGIVNYVIFVGTWEMTTSQYPGWFKREVLDGILVDENRYTRYIEEPYRSVDYYDKTVVENDSVFLRKPNGDIHCTTYEVFEDLYVSLDVNPRTNSGYAAYRDDAIDVVECNGGIPESYPSWFYDFFSDGIIISNEGETILFYGDDREISFNSRCYFLRNKQGSVAHMEADTFDKYYVREGIRRL